MRALLLICLSVLVFPLYGSQEELSSLEQEEQRLFKLYASLQAAQKALAQSQQDVERLEKLIEQEELIVVLKRIDSFEERKEAKQKEMELQHVHALFSQEREMMTRMIDARGPNEKHAQELLDRILRLITELSDRDSMKADRIAD